MAKKDTKPLSPPESYHVQAVVGDTPVTVGSPKTCLHDAMLAISDLRCRPVLFYVLRKRRGFPTRKIQIPDTEQI